MPKWLRLWGKKRGTRMSGWWLVGRVGEAAFFGVLLLLGIISLTTVVTWQVFWPESNLLPIGFGFWLMVIASSSFIVIGLTGFSLEVSRTLASPERRNALLTQVKRDHQRRSQPETSPQSSCLPGLQSLMDSPGVRLAYRLAEEGGQRAPIVLSALFAVSWNTLFAVLLVIAVQNVLSNRTNWFLIVLLVPFGTVSVMAVRWFFQLFRAHTRIGPTAVEISDLPLLPGRTYQVYLCQFGRVEFSSLNVRLVGFEETTYQQGTDVRTERTEFASYQASRCKLSGQSGNGSQSVPSPQVEKALPPDGRLDADSQPNDEELFVGPKLADPENPLELACQFQLPNDMMHSFYGLHNSVRWKIVVEGEIPEWPTFRRSFPVVVYPRDAP